ncbi:snRNA-activating protein complex subunit 4 [Folsomia candida]|uniref:snRNA-activating protein complex subunit 4 n=2 Tax=Folsomia candida TaxID=158441 RepID=A0A226E3C6_FOLCA|nr:snRNA-activating protein complex subunit 4 [Folsomia candida]
MSLVLIEPDKVDEVKENKVKFEEEGPMEVDVEEGDELSGVVDASQLCKAEIPDASVVHIVNNEMDAFLSTLQDDDIQMFGGRRSDAAFKRKDIGEDDDSSSNSGSDYESDEGRKSRSRPSKNKKWKDAEEEEPCSSGSLGRRPSVAVGGERKDLLNTSSYRRREKQDHCPPAAPIKTKLGRNPEAEIEDASIPVTEEERLFSEADVKLACAALKTNEIMPKADITSPLPLKRFTGSIVSTMMRTLHISKEATIRQYDGLKRIDTRVLTQSGDERNQAMSLHEMKQSIPIFLNGILKAEHLVYIASCVDAKARLDNKKWLIELADVFLHNQKYEMLEFCTRTAGIAPFPYGKKTRSIDCLEFTHRLREIKNMMKMDLYKLAGSGRVVAMQINEATANMQSVKTQKYELLEKFQELYLRENLNDAKFDEMSITGIRGVKMMMEPPYFKTEDGMLAFEFPNANRNAQKNHMPFPIRKQKWTSKDLKALKQAIKECVVSQRIDDLNGRYAELLLESDMRRKDELCREGKLVDEFNQPPRKRRRGRPTKEETMRRDKYGIVYPVLFRTPNHTVAYELLPKQLSEWRTMMENRLRNMNFDTLMKDKNNDDLVDWDEVSLKMMSRTKKLRSDDDCSRTYTHAIDPKINHKRLTAEQTKRIQHLNDVEKVQDWDEIARRISVDKNGQPTLPHTAFQCMKRYITHVAPPPKPVWTKEMDEKLKTGIQENPGHWRKVAASLNHEGITKRVAQERYKKLNPFIKVGPFSRTEDCLLLLTMQRLKPFLCDEGHFGYLLHYLPWRYETTWRDRATNLFNDWIVPWTL